MGSEKPTGASTPLVPTHVTSKNERGSQPRSNRGCLPPKGGRRKGGGEGGGGGIFATTSRLGFALFSVFSFWFLLFVVFVFWLFGCWLTRTQKNGGCAFCGSAPFSYLGEEGETRRNSELPLGPWVQISLTSLHHSRNARVLYPDLHLGKRNWSFGRSALGVFVARN